MISFQPSEDQKLMHDSVSDFAATLRPRIREIEKLRALPADLVKTVVELGLGTAGVPEVAGGAGLPLTTIVLIEEAIANGDSAAGFAMPGPGALGTALLELGTSEQAKSVLSVFTAGFSGANRFGAVCWSEPKANTERPGLVTTARKDGNVWVLDGSKTFVSNADRADVFVVFAQVDASKGWNGIGAFVIEKGDPGVTIGPRATTLGLDAGSFGSIELKGVRTDQRLEGNGEFDTALVRFFVKEALRVAARCVGLSQAACETTREYVATRKAFGKPIGHFQAVAFNVADRAMDVEAARGLVWRAASLWDQGKEKDALLASAHAIAFAKESAMRCGDDAVQLHGGSGFMRDYPVEKWMRDAKQLSLCVMTASQADQLAAAVELGRPLDPGQILPTAETQPCFT
jgi:alkylation response protein AidB-like acyl-CoA dehydrogenase